MSHTDLANLWQTLEYMPLSHLIGLISAVWLAVWLMRSFFD